VAGIVRGRQFCAREKRGLAVGKTKKGKGTKWMVLVDGKGIPLGALLASASPAEVTLVEETIDKAWIPGGRQRHPDKVIADKAYDCDALRERLRKKGIELISPHRRNRKRARQDRRKLRCYRRRWKVERTFAWIGNFRRLVVRYDRLLSVYTGFFHVACILITLRHL
jgi:transposase